MVFVAIWLDQYLVELFVEEFLDRLIGVISSSNPDFDGDAKLPSERDLSEALGINRTSLREKMAVLEAMGFLTRNQGSGTFLSMPKSHILQLTFDMALKMNYTTIEHIEGTREIIEIGIARQAAMNATDEDIHAMEYFLERLLETTDVEYGHELDHAFHNHLGAAAHNPVLTIILDSFSPALRKVLQHRRLLVSKAHRGLEKTNETHIAIFEAVSRHNPEAAVKAMESHFSVWQEYAKKSGQ